MLRQSLFAGLAAAGLALSAEPASAQTTLTTELFVQGVSQATDLTFAPGDPTRVFIVQQGGIIRVVENGTLLSTPFLNIDPLVLSGGERGLLGLAFHPDYQSNGRFFVNYTNNSGNTRVAEFAVTANPNVASNTVVRTIASINQDFSNHNGGCIKFGPDGMLYVGMGDGGSGNDPNNRAQNGNSLLGKMLRYDVDIAAPYIPSDNPFLGTSGVNNAICHIGLRNPWRFTFDRQTGDMWIGDVGQNQREEIDFIPAGVLGENLGWRCKEGNR
ncbi:MAG: PQQ-dependent sugar dehydrogenase, partial [Acidimicrobiales bacterium]|nr:PQQ-dependent sugar dehydrogenase [Acidimicrobiales bacterium]